MGMVQPQAPVASSAPFGPRGAAVITPYHCESLDLLWRCHQSCLDQAHFVRHVMVADGHPRPELENWDIDHLVLPQEHADNGNTPRCAGVLSAINRGYWPILFLDADNYYRPWHTDAIARLRARFPLADVLAMGRELVLPNGTPVPGLPDEDLLIQHVDTSCYVFYPSAFRVLALWGLMPPYLGPICDRFIFEALHQLGFVLAGTRETSVVFSAHYSWAYRAAGREVPNDVHDIRWDQILERFDPQEVYARTGVRISIGLQTSISSLDQQGSPLTGPRLACEACESGLC
jgi:hypothetical protein